MAEEQLRLQPEVPSRIERISYKNPDSSALLSEFTRTHTRPGTVNFACMVMVAGLFDIVGLFFNEVPFVGVILVVVADFVFAPWFHFSGMKFDKKLLTTMATGTGFESIPFVGNLPFVFGMVVYAYYSN